jgi:DNA-binding transcriptional regulator YdaS (Cro superfamily)
MRENGDGSLQAGSTLVVGDQKAQKHADGRSALFRRCPSTPLTGIQDKLAQLVSIKPALVFSQALQQLTQVKAVIIERGIAGAALLAHPAAERDQKDRIHDDFLSAPGRDDIGEPGISEKQKRTLSEVSRVCAAISWASASIQVPHEVLDHPFVQRGDRSAFPTSPMNQVLGRSNVPPSRYLCIARLAQLLSKPFKQAPIWAAAKFLDAERRLEKLFQHDVLLFRTS